MDILKKILVLNLVWLFVGHATYAQGSEPKKLTKNEKIWQEAYDDTTRALATLFIEKRSRIVRSQKKMFIVLGASAVAFGAGGYMLERELNSSSAASYDITNYAGLIFMVSGAAGVIGSGVMLGVTSIRLNPYTLRKYRNLVKIHRAGKVLPEFYSAQLYD